MTGEKTTVGESAVRELLGDMTPTQTIGHLVMGLNAPGWKGLSDIATLIRRYGIASMLSCAYRDLSPAEAAHTNNELQRLALSFGARVPLLNAGDFDQGLATQMESGATALPHQMGIGATWDPGAAERAALVAGREIAALGFNWTFGPDADVNTNPHNPVIGVRSFGGDPQLVAELTAAQIRGYRRAGILSTAKHFPGHGDTSLDSHVQLPIQDCSPGELESIHLRPFRAAIGSGVDSIMTAHVVAAALDAHLPATLSWPALTGLLRRQLGFDGIIITDLMSMGAISSGWGSGEAAVTAIGAGADIVLAGGSTEEQVEVVEALIHATERGVLKREGVAAAATRVLRARVSLGRRAGPIADAERVSERVHTLEHQAIAADLASRSIMLLRNQSVLPFQPLSPERTLIVGPTHHSRTTGADVSYVELLANMIRSAAVGPAETFRTAKLHPVEGEIEEAVRRARVAHRVVALTYSAGEPSAAQGRLVRAIASTGKRLVAVSTGTPYDIQEYPDVPAAIACCALGFVPIHLASPGVLQAAVDVIFGAASHGRLPVHISARYPLGHGLTRPAATRG